MPFSMFFRAAEKNLFFLKKDCARRKKNVKFK